MEFFKNIGRAVSGVAGLVGEKSRKAAYLNRIRTVIKCEEQAAEREYLALGRYYYNNLRDKSNSVTEAHCAELEEIEARLDKALNCLEELYQDGAAAVAVIGGEDGPTAVCVKDGAGAEEITLDDVESFDHDPMAEPAKNAGPVSPAEPDENDGLPFEG